jgi:lipopolysaccharide export LptBFGC system permease protein LptF
MMRNLSKVDAIMLFLAFISLIVSEMMWFTGEKQGALFIGLWVPSILGFAIYLKLLRIGRDG